MYAMSYNIFQDSSTNSAIAEISNKIDTEIASLKTLMESNKLDTIRYLAGMLKGSGINSVFQKCKILFLVPGLRSSFL